MFDLPLNALKIKDHLPPGESIFLVGGCVRDSLLQKKSKDFDYVTISDPRGIARRFADVSEGAFFVLDEERNTCRVLVNHGNKDQSLYDFAQLRGNTIGDDLSQRDFTINAMAVDLQNPKVILDPHKGGRDLQKRILQPVTATSLSDDPVRCIRAVRYAIAFNLQISTATGCLIKTAADNLHLISAERKRDELFKILEGEKIGNAIQLLDNFRILNNLGFTHSYNLTDTARRADVLSDIVSRISLNIDPEKKSSFFPTSLYLRLAKYRKYFSSFFFDRNQSGRTHASLVQMANLFLDSGTTARESVEALLLSSLEADQLLKMIFKWKEAGRLLNSVQPLTTRDMYLLFKEYGVSGLDLVILTLAEYASRVGSEFSQDQWLGLLESADNLIQMWFERPEVVNPKPILDGNELMERFNLAPGELIGKLLEFLKEEQAAGNIVSRRQAEACIIEQLLKMA